jgi:hypothetical protein
MALSHPRRSPIFLHSGRTRLNDFDRLRPVLTPTRRLEALRFSVPYNGERLGGSLAPAPTYPTAMRTVLPRSHDARFGQGSRRRRLRALPPIHHLDQAK